MQLNCFIHLALSSNSTMNSKERRMIFTCILEVTYNIMEIEGQSKESRTAFPQRLFETEVWEEEEVREGRLASRFVLKMLLYELTRAARGNAVARR